MTTNPTAARPEVDDPRVLALATARQQIAYESPFNFVCPPWDGLTSDEQQTSLLDARNYLHAALRAGLVPVPPADQTTDRAAAPTDWIDGHPQLEAIAAAVWEQCRTEGTSLVVDDPRNIAVAALAAVLGVLPEAANQTAEVERLRTQNARMRHELEVMYGGAFDSLPSTQPADRAAILSEAADALDRYVGMQSSDAAPEVYGARMLIRELRRLAAETQQSGGAAPEEALDLTDGPVRCPLCPYTVTLHTPDGARAHFTTVHPEQRITGRGPGPWPLLVTDGAEAQQQPDTETPADPKCVCGHPIRQHHEDVCLLTGCGCADALEISALPEALEAVLTKRFTELGNQFSRMVVHEQGPDGWPATHPVGPNKVAEVLRELMDRGANEPAAGARQDEAQSQEAEVSPTEALLATRCDACRHTLKRHHQHGACTVVLCVCGTFQYPVEELPQ